MKRQFKLRCVTLGSGFVYVMQSKFDKTLIKVGSSVNVTVRCKQLAKTVAANEYGEFRPIWALQINRFRDIERTAHTLLKNTSLKPKCFVGKEYYITTVGHAIFCVEIAVLLEKAWSELFLESVVDLEWIVKKIKTKPLDTKKLLSVVDYKTLQSIKR